MKKSLSLQKYILSLLVFLVGVPVHAGVVVVAYMDESRLAIIDGTTYKTLVMLETGKNPHEVSVSPDQRHAYVAAGK